MLPRLRSLHAPSFRDRLRHQHSCHVYQQAPVPACLHKKVHVRSTHSTQPSSPRLLPALRAAGPAARTDPIAMPHVCCDTRTGVVRLRYMPHKHASERSNQSQNKHPALELARPSKNEPRRRGHSGHCLRMFCINTRLSVHVHLASACRRTGRRRGLDFRV